MKLSIGQVSKIFNISNDTLRYYDKIGILNPLVNPDNGYRYYLLKDLEMLGLIVGVKNLGTSLSEIKDIIKSEDINSYKDLIIKQKNVTDKKLKELTKLKITLNNIESLITKVIDFKNEYDFSKLKIINKKYTLYGVSMKNFLATDLYKQSVASLEKKLAYLSGESYFYIYNILQNNHIEEIDDMFFVKENSNIINLLQKYSKEELTKLKKKVINSNLISTNFYGTTQEISQYILLINKYFKCNPNNVAYVEYEFYLPKKHHDIIYFVNIILEV